MIRFFYGAGSPAIKEKLTDCIREDLAAGHRAILLVPEQETVSVERRMLELLPPSAQLSFEVLNFSRLANRVFRQLGDLSYHTASPAISALFMWQALNEVAVCLRQYGQAAAKDSALCELMLSTASRCKAACVSPEALLQAAEALPGKDPLKDKLNDIGLILSTFDLRIGEKFENGKDDLTRLSEKLEHHGKEVLTDTHVYIDSFTDFTAQELTVIRAMMHAAPTVSVTFPLSDRNAAEGLHLTSVLHTHQKLFAMAKALGQSVYYENENSKAPITALSYLSHNIFKMSAEKAPLGLDAKNVIEVWSCDSPFEEATAIATQIHRLIRGGCRYRDIAVVVRDATAWNGILDDALEREGIPCFISEKNEITLRPLI